jgi:hypothetical protein
MNSFGDETSALLKISREVLTNYVGNLLITQAGESGFPRTERMALFIVSWDSTNHVLTRAESACPIPFPAHWSTPPLHHSISSNNSVNL